MKLRAFILSNEEYLRAILSEILEKEGYEVIDFAKMGSCPLSFQEACPCPEGYACADIIITGIQPLTKEGLELIEAQKKKGCKVLSIVITTSTWSDKELKRSRELGCMVLTKPFTIETVREMLDLCEKEVDPGRILWDRFE